MRPEFEKRIKSIAILFSIIIALLVIGGFMSQSDISIIKIILLGYCSIVFWVGLRTWVTTTMWLCSTVASVGGFLLMMELRSSPEYWWNAIMFGDTHSAPYQGHHSGSPDLLVIDSVMVFFLATATAFGFYANWRLKNASIRPFESHTPQAAAFDNSVDSWINFLISLDSVTRGVELAALARANSTFHQLVITALQRTPSTQVAGQINHPTAPNFLPPIVAAYAYSHERDMSNSREMTGFWNKVFTSIGVDRMRVVTASLLSVSGLLLIKVIPSVFDSSHLLLIRLLCASLIVGTYSFTVYSWISKGEAWIRQAVYFFRVAAGWCALLALHTFLVMGSEDHDVALLLIGFICAPPGVFFWWASRRFAICVRELSKSKHVDPALTEWIEFLNSLPQGEARDKHLQKIAGENPKFYQDVMAALRGTTNTAI